MINKLEGSLECLSHNFTEADCKEVVKLLSANVRSLVQGSKREEITILANEHGIDIIAITETWGRSDILDSEFDIPGFRLYRKDRAEVNDKKGGGCIVCF